MKHLYEIYTPDDVPLWNLRTSPNVSVKPVKKEGRCMWWWIFRAIAAGVAVGAIWAYGGSSACPESEPECQVYE